ncbi:MAG TPA: ABC transporter permease subunit [Rhizomicrobium sp.]|nr:ABC transporter permease subunit [Rhizomicrobium sp.]
MPRKVMWRFALWQVGHFVLALVGAGLLAAAVSAFAITNATQGMAAFSRAFASRAAAFGTGHFGYSAIVAQSSSDLVLKGLAPTLTLILWGALIALIVGAPLGIVFGRGPARRALAPLIQIVAATPVFCVGLGLIWLAVHYAHWPASAHGDAGAALGLLPAILQRNGGAIASGFRLLLVPALIVGASGAASLQLSLRRAAAEAGDAPYRQGLKLMGLSTLEIERVYVAPQVIAGVLSNAGEIVLALISAAAIAEWVFDWPGDAVLFVKSVALRDWNVAALVLLLFAVIKLIADLAGALAARALAEPERDA